MIVRCNYNRLDHFRNNNRINKILSGNFNFEDGLLPLIVGKLYIVYCVIIKDGFPWYFICDEDYMGYPLSHLSPFFNMVDNSISNYWVFNHLSESKEEEPFFMTGIMTFSEWANDIMFYEKLIDGNEREEKIFSKYKELIDIENQEKINNIS